ncbi:flavin-dependent oxidoreductase [Conexibacter stalactiti]|uniref:Flavin-dependent oxidoreductase n=1 Tax=Conexibacter stalactiti TaxID=1940611 RepID=A0ABU4HP07_9ACTN|nr:flavin-dependent oxidoreductase [Conexibacter stalactiti]MDW5595033.1 flavin-dependent oxidoreductase [Conexibacter stalactiti]MEC5035675.1 flavin-dependent oxidoreductase [Conexibacter stalactiti]
MQPEQQREAVIVGGGIAGLTLALCLHERGVRCQVYESAPELRPLGVGISLLPHGTQVLAGLGLLGEVQRRAVAFRESCFFNRFGQLIHRDPAPEDWRQFLIHRGDLHELLVDAVRQRLGAEALVLGHTCTGVEQDADGATAQFADTVSGAALPERRADAVIGCDGIHSRVRRAFYPDEGEPVFSGVNMWRGVTRRQPFLSGGSHCRVGTVDPGKMVVYPIRDDVDEAGNQLVNWVAEIRDPHRGEVDWSAPGRIADFIEPFASWRFEWLDVAQLIEDADVVYEYPMSDRDPVDRWAFERVALAGDAAHPMIPRGSNGAMQAIVDARVLADALAGGTPITDALRAYEDERLERVNAIVLRNRTQPPDFLIEEVARLTGDRPFERLEDVIGADEMQELLDGYKRVAGYSGAALDAAARRGPAA